MIVGSRTYFEPTIKGVILIDCWDYSKMPDVHTNKKEPISNFYQNLVNNIKQFPVEYVVNAMTQRNTNYLSEYIDQQLLSQFPNSNLQTWTEFLDCWEVTLEKTVNQWYVAGQTWNMCAHLNSIGINRMAHTNIDGLEFYADKWSFLKDPCNVVLHEDFEADAQQWEYLKWFGYKLHPGQIWV